MQKSAKKVLTKGEGCGKIVKRSAGAGAQRKERSESWAWNAAAVSRERTLKIEQQKVLKYETQTILFSKRANRKFRESERA